MPSRAAYTALAFVRSETGCSTVLIPWVEEPVMVTPEVVDLVGIAWLKDKPGSPEKSTVRSPSMAISTLAARLNPAQPARGGPPGPPPGGRDGGSVRRPGRRAEDARVNGDVHGGHTSCGSATGASPFLTGLVP